MKAEPDSRIVKGKDVKVSTIRTSFAFIFEFLSNTLPVAHAGKCTMSLLKLQNNSFLLLYYY